MCIHRRKRPTTPTAGVPRLAVTRKETKEKKKQRKGKPVVKKKDRKLPADPPPPHPRQGRKTKKKKETKRVKRSLTTLLLCDIKLLEMAPPEVFQFGLPSITAHSFNKDRTQVAVGYENEVYIYQRSGSSWTLLHTLAEHDKPVTGIDWAPNQNRIVTCAQDRNAYVWTLDGDKWKPTLVLLRINRSATFVRWSPREDKFAVASGARCISVCYFEADNNWWVSKHIKKPIRSTVLSLDWHPNNVLLAAGAADKKARVFSAFIKGFDEKPPATPWGDRIPLNTVCGEWLNANGGWIHGIAFSPSGDSVAWTGHDSTLSVHSVVTGTTSVVKTPYLPYLSCIFLNENQVVAAGHDCVPVLFEREGSDNWYLSKILDQQVKKEFSGSTAFNMFKQMDSRAQSSNAGRTELNTQHQNTITQVRPFAGDGGNVSKYSTQGIDGKIIVWDVADAASLPSLASLKI